MLNAIGAVCAPAALLITGDAPYHPGFDYPCNSAAPRASGFGLFYRSMERSGRASGGMTQVARQALVIGVSQFGPPVADDEEPS
jgi:hypothetical protein